MSYTELRIRKGMTCQYGLSNRHRAILDHRKQFSKGNSVKIRKLCLVKFSNTFGSVAAGLVVDVAAMKVDTKGQGYYRLCYILWKYMYM